jgi:tetratricopeptide (TPR) repeat protein
VDHVPFSLASCTWFAQGIADILSQFGHDGRPVNLVEIGSGLGLFARYVLDNVKSNHPDLYRRLHMTLTDIEPESVAVMKKNPLYQAHLSHLQFATLDMYTPKLPGNSNVIYMSYLIDSLDSVTIQVCDGQPYVIEIQTHIPDETVLTLTSSFPPTVQDVPHIIKLLQDPSLISPAFARKLSDVITETYRKIPLQDSSLPRAEKDKIAEFVTHSAYTNRVFNIPIGLTDSFRQLYDQLADSGMVLIQDFGAQDGEAQSTLKDMISLYGGMMYLPVCFAYIQFLATQVGFDIWQQNHAHHEHFFLMGLLKNCTVPNYDYNVDSLKKAVTSVRTIRDLKGMPEQNLVQINAIWADLSPLEKERYPLIWLTVRALVNDGLYDDALRYFGQLPPAYDGIAIELAVLVGKCYVKKGDYLRAELFFKKALSISPCYAPAYYELGHLYVNTKRHALACDMFEKNMTYSSIDPWEVYTLIAMLRLLDKRPDEARRIIQWMIDTDAKYPGLIKPSEVDKARVLQADYLSS